MGTVGVVSAHPESACPAEPPCFGVSLAIFSLTCNQLLDPVPWPEGEPPAPVGRLGDTWFLEVGSCSLRVCKKCSPAQTSPFSSRVPLSPRQGLPRTQLRGIFQGAKVVRGPDWEWGSQDGE